MVAPTAPEPEPTKFEGTSSSFIAQPRLAPFSEKDEARIDAVTLDTAHRCLITNCLPQHAVDYAHLLPRAAAESELTQLEYAWGLRWGTLNIDTHFNVLRLRKDIHALFDEGKLILLPEQDIVMEYMMRKGKPDFEGDRRNNVRYKYTLIASPDMDGYSLRRLRFPAQPGESQELMEFSYPFADFPTLESHVHPCFAICQAGRISDVYEFDRGISTDLANRLLFVTNIYYRWRDVTPCLEFRKNPKLSPDDDDDRSDAGKTRMYRVDHFSLLQRIQNHKNNDPPKGRRKKKREHGWEQHDCYDGKRCIDLHNLRSISGFFSGIFEDPRERKRKLVRNWVSSIIGQTFVEDDDMMSQMQMDET